MIKKRDTKRVEVMTVFVFVVVLVLSIGLISAQIQTQTESGKITTKFLTTDIIYAKSLAGLCQDKFETVSLYVVDSSDIESMDDVRGDFSEVNLTSLFAIPSNTLLWDSPIIGDYAFIVDCNSDGEYHVLEPLTEFSVIFEAGSADVSIGENDFGDREWSYDSDLDNSVVEMLQISITSSEEDVNLNNITIKASGTGNDREVDAIMIYFDENDNGKIDSEEDLIGELSPGYPRNNVASVVPFEHTVVADSTQSYIIAYQLTDTTSVGNYSIEVRSLIGTGDDSGEVIDISGIPIKSGTLTVLPAATCKGVINMKFSENPIPGNSTVTITVNNLKGCDGKTVRLTEIPCDRRIIQDLKTCVVEGDGCEMEYFARESDNFYTCIDKNDDKDFEDSGESAVLRLVVLGESDEEEEIVDEEKEIIDDKKEEETKEEEPIDKGEENPFEGSSLESITAGSVTIGARTVSVGVLLAVFEVTLLLILLVLVMILVRLRVPPPQAVQETPESTEVTPEPEKDESSSTKKTTKK